MPVHGADLKKYINAVSLRIIADAKEYGVAAVMVLLYAVAVNLIFHAFCPLVIFCGFPCPGPGWWSSPALTTLNMQNRRSR